MCSNLHEPILLRFQQVESGLTPAQPDAASPDTAGENDVPAAQVNSVLGAQMTKDEFEKMYAERYDVTVEWLHEHNYIGLPCSCGENGCEGWRMAHLTKRAVIEVLEKIALRGIGLNPEYRYTTDFLDLIRTFH